MKGKTEKLTKIYLQDDVAEGVEITWCKDRIHSTDTEYIRSDFFKMEYILCAANWYKDLPTPAHNPKNIQKGVVFSGFGHVHCLHQMVAMTGKRQCEAGEEVTGFLTSKNRFVDRKEAAKIALACGQINELKYSSTQLYSEDLYGLQ